MIFNVSSRILQKSEAPVLESLSCPPFESELKRACQAQKASNVSKLQIQTELGTSVAPRQRPKGNVSSQNLPLVLPSSPSPRNAIASPSPQVPSQTNDPNGETVDKSSVVQSTPTKSNATGNLFEATFSTNFADSTAATNLPQSTPTIGSKNDIQSPTSPLHQSLLNAPKTLTAGHRRISSDTTAFNK